MCVALMGLGDLYNDMQLGEQWLARSRLTALGYSAFGVGALDVALPLISTPNVDVGSPASFCHGNHRPYDRPGRHEGRPSAWTDDSANCA